MTFLKIPYFLSPQIVRPLRFFTLFELALFITKITLVMSLASAGHSSRDS